MSSEGLSAPRCAGSWRERCLKGLRDRVHPLYRLRRNRLFRAVLDRVDAPIWVRLHGVTWKVRVRLVSHASYYMLQRTPEERIVALFEAICRVFAPLRFWDVGANMGYYSWLVKNARPEAEVVMFEPDLRNVSLIRQTIERTKVGGIEVRPVAVSDTQGEKLFQRDRVSGLTGTLESRASSFSLSNWGVTPEQVPVAAVTLDGESQTHEAPDFLKVDVEGHEQSVLVGGLNVLRAAQPLMIVECFHQGRCLTTSLAGLGYSFWDGDRMVADLADATNVLALPERCGPDVGRLIDAWRGQLG